MKQAALEAESKSGEAQYLVFQVGDEIFGVPILAVREIIGFREVTPIPNTPSFLRGVLNLRGLVVPVVDVRKQFRMEEREYDRFTVIIIVAVLDKVMGLIVDGVRDVADFPPEAVRPRPELKSAIDSKFIEGVVSSGDDLVLLIDLPQIFTDEQIGILDRISQESPKNGEGAKS